LRFDALHCVSSMRILARARRWRHARKMLIIWYLWRAETKTGGRSPVVFVVEQAYSIFALLVSSPIKRSTSCCCKMLDDARLDFPQAPAPCVRGIGQLMTW